MHGSKHYNSMVTNLHVNAVSSYRLPLCEVQSLRVLYVLTGKQMLDTYLL